MSSYGFNRGISRREFLIGAAAFCRGRCVRRER